jgi:hypothetical protein
MSTQLTLKERILQRKKGMTVQDKVTFYKKYKTQINYILVGIIALAGGNIDRIAEFSNNLLPDLTTVNERLDILEEQMKLIKSNKIETTVQEEMSQQLKDLKATGF